MPHIRKRILSQCVTFVHGLFRSRSLEIQILANIVARDTGSTTGSNLYQLSQEFNVDPWRPESVNIIVKTPLYAVPEEERWRLPFVDKLLSQRRVSAACGEKLIVIKTPFHH